MQDGRSYCNEFRQLVSSRGSRSKLDKFNLFINVAVSKTLYRIAMASIVWSTDLHESRQDIF